MTLIITRLVSSGIAMAADSTVTHIEQSTGRVWAVPGAARKLHAIPELCAGVSSWGRGTINGTDTDHWIQEFIQRRKSDNSIAIFASRLATELNQEIGNQLDGSGSIGFHVTGFEQGPSGLEPTFWHVHDGKSEMCSGPINPRRVNANHDCTPQFLRELYSAGRLQTMRNGDFISYAVISGALKTALGMLESSGLVVPASQDVAAYSAFNVLEIRLMSDLYAMSSLVPGIGGRIDFLTIDCAGRMTTGSHH